MRISLTVLAVAAGAAFFAWLRALARSLHRDGQRLRDNNSAYDW